MKKILFTQQHRTFIFHINIKFFSLPVLISSLFFITCLLSPHSSVQAQSVVNPITGRLSLTMTDLVLEAGTVNLEIRRSLHQDATIEGGLGRQWLLNWEFRLTRKDTLVWIETNSGILPFRPTENENKFVGVSGGQIIFDEQNRATWIRPNATKSYFDGQGRLVEQDARNGNKIVLHYGENGHLTKIEGPWEYHFRFLYNEAGRIITIESSTGTTVQYGYAGDHLSEVQVNGGPTTRYEYNDAGQLALISDPLEGDIKFDYDSEGRITSRRWIDGSEERYEYDDQKEVYRHIHADGGVISRKLMRDEQREVVTDPLGNKTIIDYNDAGLPMTIIGPTRATVQIEYDELGRILSVKDPLKKFSRYEYLDNTALPKKIVTDGTSVLYDYDSNYNLISISYDNRIIGEFNYTPNGLIRSMRGVGQVEQTFDYHPDGRLKSVANALGHKTLLDYDLRGNLIRETNPLGGVIVRRYDAQNRLVSETGPVGDETRYKYDAQGRLESMTITDGGVTRYEYDKAGRLIAETDPSGRTTRYHYDAAGRLVKTIYPDKNEERYRYDQSGNLIELIDQWAGANHYKYDAAGKLLREIRPGGLEVKYDYDAQGNLVFLEDSSGVRSQFQYDALNRLTLATDSLGGTVKYQYDPLGNVVSETDPLGGMKSFSYNANGILMGVYYSNGDEVRYEYNPAGLMIAAHRPSGGITRFEYDEMGNLASEKDPLGNESRYAYDLAGRVLAFTDGEGGVTRFHYDAVGKLIRKRLPDDKEIRYRYDESGRLLEADDATYPLFYTYDSAGRLTRAEYPIVKKTVTYEYDKNGRRRQLVLPDGQAIHYEHDELGQLAAIVVPNGEKISFTYDRKGREETVAYPNGITGSWEYNTEGRITRIKYEDKKGKVLSSVSYLLDKVGNIIERRDESGEVVLYKYDKTGQLLEESSPDATTNYRYGPGGNRIEVQKGKDVEKYRHDAGDRLVAAGGEKFNYDSKGNRVLRQAKNQTEYTYDGENRLIKVISSNGTEIEYSYDTNGNRVWRKDEKGVTHFLYDKYDLIQELDENLYSQSTYIYATGIDKPLAMIRGEKYYYYHTDHLGSVRYISDDKGKVAAQYKYDAFGNFQVLKGSVSNPFTFTAREFDASVNLYYYRKRYFDPKTGRFLSLDPIPSEIDKPLDQNPYLYVQNNPIRFIDPLGLTYEDPSSIFIDPRHDPSRSWYKNPRPRINKYRWYTLSDLKHMRTTAIANRNWLEVSAIEEQIARQRKGVTMRFHKPNYSRLKVPLHLRDPYKRGIMPSKPWKSGAKSGGAIATLIGGIHFAACVQEGGDKAWCAAKFGLAVGAGALFGGLAATYGPAVLAAAATKTGISLAAANGIAALSGVIAIGKGTIDAGGRLAAVEETKSLQAQQATQKLLRKKSIEVINQSLQNIDKEIGLFTRKYNTKEIIKKVDTRAGNIANTIAELSKQIDKLYNNTKMSSDDCKKIQDKITKADDCLSETIKNTTHAKKSFEEAKYVLEWCPPKLDTDTQNVTMSPIEASNYLVNEAKTLRQSALWKYQSNDCDINIPDQVKKINELNTTIANLKGKLAERKAVVDALKNGIYNYVWNGKFGKIDINHLFFSTFAGKAGTIAIDFDDIKKLSEEESKIVNDFNRDLPEFKRKMHNKITEVLGKAAKLPFSAEFKNNLGADLKYRARFIDELKLTTEAYQRALIKLKPALTGLMSFFTTLSEIEKKLVFCSTLKVEEVENKLNKASVAIQNLENKKIANWEEAISREKKNCQLKLAQTQKQPPTAPGAKLTLQSIDIEPPIVECSHNEKYDFTAWGKYIDGSRKDLTGEVGWNIQPSGTCKISPETEKDAMLDIKATSIDGIPGTAKLILKAKKDAAVTTPPSSTTGDVECYGSRVEPNPATMVQCGKVPVFKIAFLYKETKGPETYYWEVGGIPAKCGIDNDMISTPDEHPIICSAIEPESGKPKGGETTLIVTQKAGACDQFGTEPKSILSTVGSGTYGFPAVRPPKDPSVVEECGPNAKRNESGKCECLKGYAENDKGICDDPMDESHEGFVKSVSEGQEKRGEEIIEEALRTGEEEPSKGSMEELTEEMEERHPPATGPPSTEQPTEPPAEPTPQPAPLPPPPPPQTPPEPPPQESPPPKPQPPPPPDP